MGDTSSDEDGDEHDMVDWYISLGGQEDPHPGLLAYLRQHQEYRDRPAFTFMLMAMIQKFSQDEEDAGWDHILPLEIFRKHWWELEHPWVGRGVVLEQYDTPAVKWLELADGVYAGGGKASLQEFVGIYDDAKAFATPEVYPLEDPRVNDGSLSVTEYLQALEEDVWNFAIEAASAHTQDVAATNEMRIELADRLEVRRRNGKPLNLVAPCCWSTYWSQLRLAFDSRNPSVATQARFGKLFEGAYQLSKLSRVYRLPPQILPDLSPEEMWDAVEACRLKSVANFLPQWGRSILRRPHEDNDAFQQRRDDFTVATSSNDVLSWGYGPLHEIDWIANKERSYSTFELRTTLLQDYDQVWMLVEDLHFLKRRLKMVFLVPDWPSQRTTRDYVDNVLQPMMYRKALEIVEQEWQDAIAGAALLGDDGELSAADLQRFHDTMVTEATAGNTIPFAPDHAKLLFAWEPIIAKLNDGRLVNPVTRGRIEDMYSVAKQTSRRYKNEFLMPHPWSDNETVDNYCEGLSATLWDDHCSLYQASWNALKAAASEGDEMRAIDERIDEMEAFYARTGAYYRADEDQPWRPSRAQQARQLGSGTNRANIAPAGNWTFIETAGGGTFGHAGVWARHNITGDIIEKIIVKETYLTISWDQPWLWHGNIRRRVPKEYRIVKRRNRLANSQNIVRYLAYGIYESLRMHRIYMEVSGLSSVAIGEQGLIHLQVCQHGTLRDLIDTYQKVGTIVTPDGTTLSR